MRTRREFLGAALLGSIGCRREAPIKVEPGRDTSVSRPLNLVFVSIDALQAAHVGCLGYPKDTTPNLDRFAKSAITFKEATSVASWTVPATMSWFTGVYPSEHRLTNKFAVWEPPIEKPAKLKEMAPSLTTLAEELQGRGYATGAFTGNAGVSGEFGFAQGFDVYSQPRGVFGGFESSVPKALDWVREHRERSFFLFLHGYDVHGQFDPDDLNREFVDPRYDGRFTGAPQEQEQLREEGLDRGRLDLRDADFAFWQAIYDGKVARADRRLGRFLEEYERHGLLDRTVFVVTSDHGTELGEHGRLDHGFTLHQELLHVPLFIRVPQAVPAWVEERVSSIDVLPTLLDLLGVPSDAGIRAQLRGTNLLHQERPSRDIFAETDYRAFTFKRAVISPDGWKLISTLDTGTRELFDLNADPGERRDLTATEPTRADALQNRLFAHFRAIGRDLTEQRWQPGLNPVYPSQGKVPKSK